MVSRSAVKKFDQLELEELDVAAKLLYCSRRQIQYGIAEGAIKAFRPGAKVMVDMVSAKIWFLSKSTSKKIKARKGAPRKR